MTLTERYPPLAAVPASGAVPSTTRDAVVVSIRELRMHCMHCHLREQCLPVGLELKALREFDAMVTHQPRSKKGSLLFRAGDPFTALYAIRVGSYKTTILTEDGREQVTGYHMSGDVIGLDGVGNEHHACDAVALEDTEVCALPFAQLEKLARTLPPVQHNLHQLLSRDIARGQNLMLMLGSMHAEERLAGFLLNLSERYGRRGYSSTGFVLRMTRQEIGSYLGIKLETVSRLFSRLQREGLLQVQGREVKLWDRPALRRRAGLHP